MTMPAQKPRPKKLLEKLRDELRTRHYALRTENTYIAWVRKYILFHNKRHPKKMGAEEINAFLTHLALDTRWWSAMSKRKQIFRIKIILL